MTIRPFLLWCLCFVLGILFFPEMQMSLLWSIVLWCLVSFGGIFCWYFRIPFTVVCTLLSAFLVGDILHKQHQRFQHRTMQAPRDLIENRALVFEGVLLEPVFLYKRDERRLIQRHAHKRKQVRRPPIQRHVHKRERGRHPLIRRHVHTAPSLRRRASFLGRSTLLLRRVAKRARGPWRSIFEKVRLRIRGRLPLQRGQWLRVRLRLRQPRHYANPGQYDSWAALARQGIRFQGSAKASKILCLGRPQDFVWQRIEGG
ncbi:MAG: DUF4131 domain-containing protein [Myxococcota bacterium]